MKKLNIKKVILIIIPIILVVGIVIFMTTNNTKTTDTTPIDNQEIPVSSFASLSYYIPTYEANYSSYQQANPSYSIEDIVTHVNMGIDVPFFSTEPRIVTNPEAIDSLVNKVYQLPLEWVPSDLVTVDNLKGQKLRQEAADAFLEMADVCRQEGFEIYVYSGYRSNEFQNQIYTNMVDNYGVEYTDQYVARPGHSEHATGLAADISIDGGHYEDIADSVHYEFLKSQFSNYGFILRYPEGKENITGYGYESWHVRYVGVDLAKKVEQSNLTYDEYVARNMED